MPGWGRIQEEAFDAFIGACGYEGRSRFVLSSLRQTDMPVLVLDYESYGVLSYDVNRRSYEASPQTAFIPVRADAFEERLAIEISGVARARNTSSKIRILFDVSSCSRRLIARTSLLLRSRLPPGSEVVFVYALADYYLPPAGELPSHISEPVIGDLAGWSDDLSKPPCAIIGLGFEPGRALGCIDYLEIPTVRLFVPHGPDPRFLEDVVAANDSLLGEVGHEYVFDYSILNAAETYEKIESLVFGLLPRFRPVIIPLGPKIFSVMAIHLAIETMPWVCVWRTSSGDLAEARDIEASGEVVVFPVVLASVQAAAGQERVSVTG